MDFDHSDLDHTPIMMWDSVDINNQPSICGIMTPGTVRLQREDWARAQLPVVRSYQERVLDRVEALQDRYKVASYGRIQEAGGDYDLKYVVAGDLKNGKPNIMITGGTHGYEEGGVEGVLEFLEKHMADYTDRFNFVVVPCISPWAYEHDRRLTGRKANPNRNFFDESSVAECQFFVNLVRNLDVRYRFFVDCHETTWTDPVIIAQENPNDPMAERGEHIDPLTYNLENVEGGFDPVGAVMIDAVEKEGFDIVTENMGEYKVTHGVTLNNLGYAIKGMSMEFMTRAHEGYEKAAVQAVITEPFVTEALFQDTDGLKKRANAQVVQIRAALDKMATAPVAYEPHKWARLKKVA